MTSDRSTPPDGGNLAVRRRRAVARCLGVLVLAGAVSLTGFAGAFAATPSPPPPRLPAIASTSVEARYSGNRQYIKEAARMAEKGGDTARAGTLRAMAGRDRQFLAFDGRAGGRAVEVFGDLTGARHIAVLVPGADTSLDTFDSPSGLSRSAHALYGRMEDPQELDRVAVVAWLGYAAPETMSLAALTTGRADDGARELRRFVMTLRSVNGAEVALFCHSYGSVVCGRAAPHVTVSDIVVYGSPGMGADSYSSLATEARLWAALSEGDWIGLVPNVSVSLFDTTVGFGADPTNPSFGASSLDPGDVGHGGYMNAGGRLIDAFALIAGGRGEELVDV